MARGSRRKGCGVGAAVTGTSRAEASRWLLTDPNDRNPGAALYSEFPAARASRPSQAARYTADATRCQETQCISPTTGRLGFLSPGYARFWLDACAARWSGALL